VRQQIRAFRSSASSTRRPASGPAFGALINKLTIRSDRQMRFSIVYSPSRCRRVTRFRDRKIVNGMPPNLLAHYLYLEETTVVPQAIETAWISVSSGGHSSS